MGFLPDQESLYRKTNVFEKKLIVSFVGDLYRIKVTWRTWLYTFRTIIQWDSGPIEDNLSTRWNSTFYMMERILQQQQPLCATLIEICWSDLVPTDAEISNMEGFVEAMRPFAEITKVMEKGKFCF